MHQLFYPQKPVLLLLIEAEILCCKTFGFDDNKRKLFVTSKHAATPIQINFQKSQEDTI